MKKYKNQRYLIIALITTFVFLIIEVAIYSSTTTNNSKTYKISMIVYGQDAGRWENMKNGAELACEESGTEISLITLSDVYDPVEQCALIEREVENGADALIVAACDSSYVGGYIAEHKFKVPIVFAETDIFYGYAYDYVSADNYMLGKNLAKHIIENEKDWIKVAIVTDNMRRESVKDRAQGVYDVLSGYTDNIVYWERNENELGMLTRKYLQRCLVEEAVDVVVTLDSETTDAFIDAMDNLNKTRKVYSIATTSKAVYSLDHEKIKAIEYQDEFGIGYLAATKALKYLDIDVPKGRARRIASRIVVREDMYVGDTEKIIFPFVK